jgi:hypothetical protein
MRSLPHAPTASLRLDPCEREIILTVADDEGTWHVHTDSRRAVSSRLLRVARALGIAPERAGPGWTFDLPLAAVSFRAPKAASAAQRDVLRRARLRARTPVATGGAEARAAEGKVSVPDGPRTSNGPR